VTAAGATQAGGKTVAKKTLKKGKKLQKTKPLTVGKGPIEKIY
jgi:hypothetical protein